MLGLIQEHMRVCLMDGEDLEICYKTIIIYFSLYKLLYASECEEPGL